MFEKLQRLWREWDTLIMLIIFLLVVMSCIIGFVAIGQSQSCKVYADMDIQVQYNFWTGCMANHSQFGWIPIDEYFKVLNLNVPQ